MPIFSRLGKILALSGKPAASSTCCCAAPSPPGCGCDDNYTGDFDVEIAGVTDGTCNTCDERVNGLFTVSHITSDSSACVWCNTEDSTHDCNHIPQQVCVKIINLGASGYYLQATVFVHSGAFSGNVIWQKSITGPVDCSHIDEVLPFDAAATGSALPCTWTGSTAHVTSA